MSHVTCKRCKKQISKDETFYYIDKPVGLSGITHVKRFLESNGLGSRTSRNDDFTVTATPLWSIHFYYFHFKAQGLSSQIPAGRLMKEMPCP